jgi:hypothetical protein
MMKEVGSVLFVVDVLREPAEFRLFLKCGGGAAE